MSSAIIQQMIEASRRGDLDAIDQLLDTLESGDVRQIADAARIERERRQQEQDLVAEACRQVQQEIHEAIVARDYRRVKRLSVKLQKLMPAPPARPPRAQRPRCEAMTRKGERCKMPAVWFKGEPAPRNGRCRLHGGLSTGPTTPEGREAIRESNRRRATSKRADQP